MAVPPGSRDFDERNAGFDETPSDQTLLSKLPRAIPGPDGIRFIFDIEKLFARHQPANSLVRAGVAAKRVTFATLDELL